MNSNNWLKQPTPFLALSALALIASIYSSLAEGLRNLSGLGFFKLLLALVVVPLVIDFLFKRVLHLKSGTIWIIESIFMLGLVYWWIIS